MTDHLGQLGGRPLWSDAIIASMNQQPSITPEEVQDRYLRDPAFHRRADLAVESLEATTGIRLDEQDRSLATLSACWALLIAERFP